ncbi:DUF6544 family protein [Rhodohalobacter sp.]|uniref:DUF6544 family protein n=1 Tax=Rhodohalobacter sp. TaxID=1974210 RepID=UPI002ACEFB2F|nr:DUF6544 family protein [Rhodohalobacter sp.]MDZ7757985.1 DUF6544 family protein [Rhodohalobacter sp.]
MVKSIFSLIILIHGLIHLLGFFKAFDIGDVNQLTAAISKPVGIIWLIATVLFLMTALTYLLNYSVWPFLAMIAVIVSQVLIFTVWGDAKFGTIANIIVLLAAIPAIGHFMFSNMVEHEQTVFLEQVTRPSGTVIASEDLDQLPPIVQTWLKNSGVPGKPDVTFVRLKQTGEMKTTPDGKWMEFSAVQYFDTKRPAFNWSTEVQMMPLVHLAGRDKLTDGQGEMIIKLLSLFNVVNEKNNEKINSGTMIRYLGEICWFPAAALNEYISWEEIDELSAKATLAVNGEEVSGIFRFSEEGDFTSFEAERYYGGGEEAKLQRWVVEATEHSTLDGYRIPTKLSVTWKLPEGDFTWLHLEITDLEVNKFET